MAVGLTDAQLKEMNRVRPKMMTFIGVDLGQLGSHSAIVVLERFEQWSGEYTDILRSIPPEKRYVVRHAERIALGTTYREVVQRLKQIVLRIQQTSRQCVIVVDKSGPGVPVVERMNESDMGCGIIPYVITSGQNATDSTVPRTELLTRLQLMAQHDELEIAAGCLHGEQLVRELIHLQLKGGGAAATGERDDLALALALACWKARARW